MKNEETALDVENRLDPRQKLCWDYYIDQKNPTFSNAYASAVKAGYTHDYSTNITCAKWFRHKVRRTSLLGKAEKVLNKALTAETMNDKGMEDAALLRVQVDAAKHITKTLGKDEGYSERSEVTGGNSVVFLPQELINKFNLGKPEEGKPEEPEEVKPE
jgi:hypothetical protein